jgi:hypothetical protein
LVHRREARLRLQERRIRRIILVAAYYDRERGEVVSEVSRLDVIRMLAEPVQVSLVPGIVHGTLADSGFFFTSEAKLSFSRVGKPPKFAISVEKYLLLAEFWLLQCDRAHALV